jgi:hypothetical protein
MPPAKAFASVTVLLAATLLWLTVVLLIVADAWGVTKMPPPCASPQTALLESSTVLPLTALAAIVSLPSEVMPPPSALHPFGADVIARLRLTTALLSVRFLQFWIPAPLASLATGPPA